MKKKSITSEIRFKIQPSSEPGISSCTQMKKTLAFIVLLMTTISLQVLGQASLNFYGNSNYLSKGSVISTVTTNFTIEAWVKWDGTGVNQAAFYNGNTGLNGYGIYLNGSGQIRVLMGGAAFINSGVALTSGEWTHLAVARNSNTLTLYKNGVSIATSTVPPYNPNGNFTIGSNNNGGETFKGSIDEVQFWTEERSQSQIQSDMKVFSLPQTNLLAYYNFNNGMPNANNTAITTVSDVSGSGNTLTLNNFTLTGNTSNFVNDTFKIHYVSAAATGTGVGNSWANAYTNLRTAIDASAPGDEVWVAAGTYTSIASYSMKEGVKIFGGFPATGNPTWADRDYINNITILKGSNGNRVIHNNNNGLTAAAVLDGFTIRDGELSYTAYTPDWADAGAGMRNDNVSPTVRNCVFTNNKAAGNGAGVLNTGGTPMFVNCTFSANICSYEVTSNDVGGGGMANRNSTPTLINCTFSGNQNYSSPSSGNHGGGGGALYNYHSDAVVTNCTFSDNIAGSRGGAVYNRAASPVFTNCHFFSNRGYEGGALHNAQGSAFDPGYSNPVFTSCVFANNRAAIGGAVYSGATIRSNSIVVFTNCVFYGNITPDPNGGWGWGGVVYSNHATHKFINCVITNNTAAAEASVIFGLAATTEIRNTVIAGNNGGVVCMNDGGVNDLYIYNSLVQSYPSYNPSNPNNTANLYADNNIDGAIDPQFVNPANPAGVDGIWGTADDGLQLQPCSPLVGAGNNTYVTGTADVTGNPRLYGENVDIGAYELQIAGDSTDVTIVTPSSENICVGSVFPGLELTGEAGQICFIINENASQIITAPAGTVFTEVIFASYGNASGSCETGFTMGSCNAPNSLSIIEDLALGNNSFTVTAGNDTFGDPCLGTAKKMYIQIAYEHSGYSYSWTNDNPAIGLPASGTGNIPSFEALEPGVANITLRAANVCGVSDPVTFTYTVEVPGPLYVDASVSVSGNGKSWATAFKTLQEALAAIPGQLCPSDSILVAKGTYMPDVNQSFSMIEGVKIVGGFPNGGGERDIVNNITILKGNSNDYSVVRNYYNNLTPASVIDGFTIANVAGTGHSAMYNVNTSPTIRNCIFTGNQANYGGAMRNVNSSPVIINCIFSENIANINGGAMYNTQSSSPVLINCLFLNNRGQTFAGAIYNNQSSISIYNSTFYGNTTVTNQAGVLYTTPLSNAEIINTVMWNNGEESVLSDGECSIHYSNIEGGYAGEGNINQEPAFANVADPDGPDNIWGTEDDGLILQHNSPGLNSGSNDAYGDSGGNIETDLDLAGNPRLYGTTIDMGTYEFQNTQGVIWTINNEWLNGIEPDEAKGVFIEGNLNIGTDYESFSAESLTVEESGSLTINEGNSVTVHGRIVNNAAAEDFLLESGANLIQTPDYENNDNQGAITVERESSPIKRLDYTIWSSPVDGQQIQAFSPMTLPNRIYTYEGTNGFVIPNVNASFEPGKGYMFRAPNNWDPDTPTVFLGKFTGVPFNGNITISTHSGSFTSVGNPYPSNIDAYGLLDENPGAGTLYFWTNTFPADGNGGYTGNNYLTYTKLGGTIGTDDLYITTGQGFIVLSGISQMTFTNNIRISSEGQFYKTEEDEKHRFWLKFSGDQDNEFNRILIGYMSGATNQEDSQIDGEMFSYDGTKLFSIIDAREFSIQGRQLPFDTSDTVPLGIKIQETGKYKISLSNYDGLFVEGNITIYIKDKALHTIHNLMESDYEFESLAGEFNNRFEIVYGEESTMGTDDRGFARFAWLGTWEESTMGTDDPNANSIRIYKDRDYIVVESEKEKILSVELYDLSGRNIHRNDKVNANVYKVRSALKGIIVVKAQTENGEIETKKVINK